MHTPSQRYVDDVDVDPAYVLPVAAETVLSALSLAQDLLLAGQKRGAGSMAVDAAVEQVRRAIGELRRVEQELETTLWDLESEEMNEELQKHGYRQEAPGWWASPVGGDTLTQLQALSRVDEGTDCSR